MQTLPRACPWPSHHPSSSCRQHLPKQSSHPRQIMNATTQAGTKESRTAKTHNPVGLEKRRILTILPATPPPTSRVPVDRLKIHAVVQTHQRHHQRVQRAQDHLPPQTCRYKRRNTQGGSLITAHAETSSKPGHTTTSAQEGEGESPNSALNPPRPRPPYVVHRDALCSCEYY